MSGFNSRTAGPTLAERPAILEWTTTAVAELSAEKGTIDGIHFSTLSFSEAKEEISSEYSSIIACIRNLRDLELRWDSLDLAGRDERLEQLELSALKAYESRNSTISWLRSEGNRLAARITSLSAEEEKIHAAFARIHTNFWVATAGALVSFALFVLLIGRTIIRQRKRAPKSPNDTSFADDNDPPS